MTKAAVLHAVGKPLTIEDVVLDAPRAKEVRIRVAASGLCHSDYHFMVGDQPHPLPVVLGHEASGIVEAIGQDVRHLQVGDAVVTCLSVYCGECAECQTGCTHRCEDRPVRAVTPGEARMTMNGEPLHQYGQLGGFAEEMLVHAHSVCKLPDGMPLGVAALLGCAVVTGIGAAVNRAGIRPGQTAAVIGCGGVGLNVIQGAKLAGASRIIAIDINPAKLELAKYFGATDTIVAGKTTPAEVTELTRGGVHFAFEVAGHAATARDAFLMLRKGGSAVLIGAAKFGTEVSFPAIPFLKNELNVIGCIMGSSSFQLDIPRYANLYLKGALTLDPLISHRLALEDINHGYAQLIAGDGARGIVVFPDVSRG
jgi:S-(hydroxymethyl)glutathione dehydrogenase/alcohol dehydrogenase